MLDSLTHASLKYGLLEVKWYPYFNESIYSILYNPLKVVFFTFYYYPGNHI